MCLRARTGARLCAKGLSAIIKAMENLKLISTLLDADSLSRYLDIGLLVLLIAVLAILVLCFLRGLLRGWKYGTYRLLSFAILITVALTTLTPLANALGGTDLSGLGLPNLNFNLQVDGQDHAIVARWTSLQGTLEDVIFQVMNALGVEASSSGLLSYASVLASSLIKLVLIFVWGIVIATLGALLIMLLWHIAFKRFTPRERRKEKHLRVVSAFEDLLIGAAIMGMLLSPWTGLVNSLNSSFKVDEKHAKEDETVSMITDMLGVYDQSAFAKTFFAWNSMDGSTTFDQQLISFLIQSNVGEVTTDFYSEISSIASMSSKVINAGLLPLLKGGQVNWYQMLTLASIPELLTELSENSLVKVALPFAVALASNMEQVKSVLGEETCKYLSSSTVDWSQEIKNLSKIYQNILDSGVLDCIKDEESETPQFTLTQLKYIFTGKDASGKDRDSSKAIHEIADSFSDSELYSRLIAGVLTQLVQNEQPAQEGAFVLSDFLPKDESGQVSYSDLVNLDFGHEFALIYDTVCDIYALSNDLVDKAFSLLDGTERTKEELDELYRSMGVDVAEQAASFSTLIVGERNPDGTPKSDSAPCLLDSALLQNALPKSVDFLEATLKNALQMESLDLSEAKSQIEEGKTGKQLVDAYKSELGSVLDVASDFASSEEGLAFLKDGSGLTLDKDGNLISVEPSLVQALQGSLEEIDDSKLLTAALPQVAEFYLKDFKASFSEFGIELPDFGTVPNFGHELSHLLNLVADSGDLLLAVASIGDASPETLIDLLLQEESSLINILDTVVESKILNPGDDNANVVGLFNSLFKNAGLEDFSFDASLFENVQLTGENGENSKIVRVIMDVVGDLGMSGIASLSGASSSEAARVLSRLNVTRVFADIGESKILSEIAGEALDVYFAPVLGYGSSLDTPSDPLSEQIGFTNVLDWAKEGEIIQKILNLASNGIDVSNFDLNNVSPKTVEGLFSALASSQIFQKTGEDGSSTYVFPKYFSSKILSMLDDSTLPYFLDENASASSSSSLEQKKAAASLFVSNCESLSSLESWVGGVDESGNRLVGEIQVFSAILSDIQSLGGADGFSSFSRGKLPILEKTLQDLASSSTLGQVMIANALKRSLSSFSGEDGIDFSLANTSLFFSAEYSQKDKRLEEVSNLRDILDTLFDPSYGLMDENGSFLSERLSLSSLSADYLLKPLLEGIVNSKLFTTPKQGSEKTLLDAAFEKVLVESSLYGEGIKTDDYFSPAHASKVTISSIVSSLSDPEREIDALCSAIEIVQGSGLLNGNQIDLSSLSEGQVDAARSLLGCLNSSELLYRALPLQLDKALSSLAISDSSLSEDLKLANPFVMENADHSDYLPYPEEELDVLASALSLTSSLSSMDFSSLSALEETSPIEVLSPLYASRIFNGTVASSGSKQGLTSAQAILTDVLSSDGVGNLLYDAASPKDRALGISNANEKAQYLLSHYLGKGEAGDYSRYPLSAQKEAGNPFYEVLGDGENGLGRALTSLSRSNLLNLLDGGEVDFLSLSEGTLSSLLKTLSHCYLLRDATINSFASALSKGDYAIEGIDLSLANVYYPYYLTGSGSISSEAVDWNAGYDDNEIDLLSILLSDITSCKDGLKDVKLTALDPYEIRSLLFEMSDSYLFHQGGPNLHSASYGKGFSTGNYLSTEPGASLNNDLTVFEQVLFLLYKKSGLAEYSFSPYRDFALLYRYNGDQTLSAEVKVHDSLKSFRGSWKKEISYLTTDDLGGSGLLKQALDLNLTTEDETELAATPELMKKLSPRRLSALLTCFSQSQICSDALPVVLTRLLVTGNGESKGLGIDEFSSYLSSCPSSDSFASDPSFLEAKHPYGEVSFASSSYDGSETLLIRGDLNGDGAYEADLTSYASSSFSSGVWGIDVSNLGCSFKIEISAPGAVSYSFDLADYFLPQEEFASEGETMQAISTLLSSLYRKNSSGDWSYYSFADSSELNEAYNNGVPLYGITSLIYESGFYAKKFDSLFRPSEAGEFSARAYVLYNALSLSASVNGVSIPVHLLDAVDAPALSKAHGSSVPLYARLASIDKAIGSEVDPYAEARFLEIALPGAAISKAVSLAMENLSSLTEDSAKTASYRYLVSLLCSEQGSYYREFLASEKIDYVYPPLPDDPSAGHEGHDLTPAFAKDLLSDALNSRVKERQAYVSLSTHVLGMSSLSSPTKPEASSPRSDYLSSASSLGDFDAYGYDEATGSYSYFPESLPEEEIALQEVLAGVSKGISLSSGGSIGVASPSSLALTEEEYASLQELSSSLDSLSGIEEDFAKLAYLADQYDFYVLKGNAWAGLLASGNVSSDCFFHSSVLLLPATDFPDPYGNGLLKGASAPFSFAAASSTVYRA